MVLNSKSIATFLCSAMLFVLVAYPVLAQVEIDEIREVTPSTIETTAVEASEAGANVKIEQLPEEGRVFGDFVVGPGKVELSLLPGESQTINLLVTNRTGVPKDFLFSVEDIVGSQNPNQSAVLLGGDRGPYSLRDYVILDYPRISLEHMERATVPVTVSIPADAEPSGHYGSVVVSTASKNNNNGDSAQAAPSSAIVSRIGTLFFVSSPGDTNREGALIDFSTINNQVFFASGPVPFGVLFENTGSVHLNPYGDITVTNLFGDEVAFIELDPWFLLPDSLRTREITWDRELLIGRYTATVNVNRGYDDIIDTDQVTFWVIPYTFLAIIFGVLFVFFLLFGLLVRILRGKRVS